MKNTKPWKKLLSLLLSVAMVFVAVPTFALAQEVNENMTVKKNVIFSDTFDTYSADNWTNLLNGNLLSAGGGSLNMGGSYGSQAIIRTNIAGWTDYEVSLEVTPKNVTGSTYDAPAVLFRVQDVDNFYMFLYDDAGSSVKLYKRVGGTFTVLATAEYRASSGSPFTLTVDTHGSSIVCYVNGSEKINTTDTTYSAGFAGIRHYKYDKAVTLDSFTVRTDSYINEELFSDEFKSYDTAVWQNNLNGGSFSSDGENLTVAGAFTQAIISAGDASWEDYEATMRLNVKNITATVANGLLFRFQDVNNFYMLVYSASDNKIKLYKRVPGDFSEIKSYTFTHTAQEYFTMTARVDGNNITCLLNGEEIITYQDSTFAAGKIGIRFYGELSESLIDYIKVTHTVLEYEPVDTYIRGFAFSDDFSSEKDFWTDKNGVTVNAGVTCDTTGYMLGGSEYMTEYRTEATLNATEGKVGVYTYYADDKNNYKIELDFSTDAVALYKGESLLASAKTDHLPKGKELCLATSLNQGVISIWIDEIKIFDITDASPLAGGSTGLFYDNTDAIASQFATKPLSVADTLPGDYPFDKAPTELTSPPKSGENTYYVSTAGNDSWSGKSDTPNADLTDGPFATVERAVSEVKGKSDATVFIRRGQYTLESTINLNSLYSGVTFANYPGETPVISGGKKVSSEWTEYDGGIWKTNLNGQFRGVDIRQLFVDDSRAVRSREPEADEPLWKVTSIDSTNYSWVKVDGTLGANLENEENLEINSVGGYWHYNRQSVKSIDAANSTIYSNIYLGVQCSGTKLGMNTSGDGVYLENSLSFVDTEGEWYYDKATDELYYYAKSGTNPNNSTVIIPTIETLVNVEGTKQAPVENLNFYGISFEHTTWYMPSDIERRGIQGGFWGSERTSPVFAPSAAVMFTYAEKSIIQNCRFSLLGEGAITLGAGANSNKIFNCRFFDVGSSAVQIGYRSTYLGIGHPLERDWDDLTDAPRGNELINSEFRGCSSLDFSSCPIWVGYSNHNLIKNNSIINCPYSGINVGWRWSAGNTSSHHNTVEANYFEKTMQRMADGAAIYFVGEQYGNKILSNYINGSGNLDWNIWGTAIYLDESSNYIEVGHNYIRNVTGDYVKKNHVISGGFINEHDNVRDSAPADPSIYGVQDIFIPSYNYTVTFLERDGTAIGSITKPEGEFINSTDLTAKSIAPKEIFGYKFAGWSQDYTTLNSDAVISATYSRDTSLQYPISLNNEAVTDEKGNSDIPFDTKITFTSDKKLLWKIGGVNFDITNKMTAYVFGEMEITTSESYDIDEAEPFISIIGKITENNQFVTFVHIYNPTDQAISACGVNFISGSMYESLADKTVLWNADAFSGKSPAKAEIDSINGNDYMCTLTGVASDKLRMAQAYFTVGTKTYTSNNVSNK